MGWETRGGREYYYRKERDGARVRSVYVGTGEVAELISQLGMMRREEAETEREARRHVRARDRETEATIDEVCALIEAVTEGALIAAGFHTHKRQWRRTRV